MLRRLLDALAVGLGAGIGTLIFSFPAPLWARVLALLLLCPVAFYLCRRDGIRFGRDEERARLQPQLDAVSQRANALWLRNQLLASALSCYRGAVAHYPSKNGRVSSTGLN